MSDSFIDSISPYWLTIKRLIRGKSGTILDVGCGRGVPMKRIGARENYFTVGVDIFKPYIIECKSNKTHDELVLCDIRFLPFRRDSFTIVLCLEVVEHLIRDEGIKVIKELEHIALNQVIISTPNGFVEEPLDVRMGEARHASGFTKCDFEKLGFQMIRGFGVKGYLRLRGGSKSFISLPRKTLAFAVYYILTPLAYFIPIVAHGLLCVKFLMRTRN